MKKITTLISLLIFTGCTLGPKVERPRICMPGEFAQKLDDTKEKLKLDEWWKNFNDESLNEYINIAIENNYDLKIAIEKIEEARSFYRIKKADLFPEIDLNAKAIREHRSENVVDTDFLGPLTQSFFQFGFDAFWEVDIFGRLRKNKEAAFYSYLQQQDSSLDVYITLLSDVARSYIDIVVLKRKIYLNEKKLALQKRIYKLTKEKFISGLADEIEPQDQIKIVENLKQNIIDLTTLYKNNIHRLAILLGQIPESLECDFSKMKKIPEITKEIEVGLPSDLIRRRPDIRKAEKFLYSQTALVGAKIAELFPSFSLVGDFNFEASKSKNWFQWASKAWSIGPSMNLPIIDFGRRLANVDVAKSLHRQAISAYKNSVILALEDVENALVAYFHEKQNYSFISKKLTAQKNITYLSRDLFTSGLDSETSYLQSRQTLIDVENEFIDKKRNVSVDLIALIKALGGGY